MPWTNLQEEVLEQFADPRWHGMALQHLSNDADLVSIVVNDNFQVVARKKDEWFTVRVRELARTRCIWTVRELITQLELENTRSTSCVVGKAMSADGWLRVDVSWVHRELAMSHCEGLQTVTLADLHKKTGVSTRRLISWLTEDGWRCVSRTKQAKVFTR